MKKSLLLTTTLFCTLSMCASSLYAAKNGTSAVLERQVENRSVAARAAAAQAKGESHPTSLSEFFKPTPIKDTLFACQTSYENFVRDVRGKLPTKIGIKAFFELKNDDPENLILLLLKCSPSFLEDLVGNEAPDKRLAYLQTFFYPYINTDEKKDLLASHVRKYPTEVKNLLGIDHEAFLKAIENKPFMGDFEYNLSGEILASKAGVLFLELQKQVSEAEDWDARLRLAHALTFIPMLDKSDRDIIPLLYNAHMLSQGIIHSDLATKAIGFFPAEEIGREWRKITPAPFLSVPVHPRHQRWLRYFMEKNFAAATHTYLRDVVALHPYCMDLYEHVVQMCIHKMNHIADLLDATSVDGPLQEKKDNLLAEYKRLYAMLQEIGMTVDRGGSRSSTAIRKFIDSYLEYEDADNDRRDSLKEQMKFLQNNYLNFLPEMQEHRELTDALEAFVKDVRNRKNDDPVSFEKEVQEQGWPGAYTAELDGLDRALRKSVGYCLQLTAALESKKRAEENHHFQMIDGDETLMKKQTFPAMFVLLAGETFFKKSVTFLSENHGSLNVGAKELLRLNFFSFAPIDFAPLPKEAFAYLSNLDMLPFRQQDTREERGKILHQTSDNFGNSITEYGAPTFLPDGDPYWGDCEQEKSISWKNFNEHFNTLEEVENGRGLKLSLKAKESEGGEEDPLLTFKKDYARTLIRILSQKEEGKDFLKNLHSYDNNDVKEFLQLAQPEPAQPEAADDGSSDPEAINAKGANGQEGAEEGN